MCILGFWKFKWRREHHRMILRHIHNDFWQKWQKFVSSFSCWPRHFLPVEKKKKYQMYRNASTGGGPLTTFFQFRHYLQYFSPSKSLYDIFLFFLTNYNSFELMTPYDIFQFQETTLYQNKWATIFISWSSLNIIINTFMVNPAGHQCSGSHSRY